MIQHRKTLVGKVHVAKAQMGLDDEAYRDILERVTGKRSAGLLSPDELVGVLAEFVRLGWKKPEPKRAGERPLARGEPAAKARALWLALYHLGEVKDPGEAALIQFALSRAGIDQERWLTGRHWRKVIEQLKGWCVRVGYAAPATVLGDADEAKRLLCLVLWMKLSDLGETKIPLAVGLEMWISRNDASGRNDLATKTGADLDRAVEKLGAWLRAAKARAA